MALNSVVRSAAPLLGVSTAQALPLVLPVLRRGYATAGEKLIAQMKRDGLGLPWERKLSSEGAVEKLRSFLGLPSGVGPGDVLDLSIDQLEGVLKATSGKTKDKELEDALFVHADGVTTRFFGRDVYFRGIVEFSNVCENDCGYCGIRKHQSGVRRYTMPVSEVREVADWAFKNRMGTLMLQSGELETEKRMDYLLEMVRTVKDSTTKLDLEQRGEGYVLKPTDELGLCIALSVGELSERNYAALKEAGARRFLLRIETTNPDLYASLHPSAMSWHNRVECLQKLRSMGFQVMVGLPGQTMRDLAGDLRFFRELGANMIGMGPYITEAGTPVAEMWATTIGSGVDKAEHMKEMFELTTRMNALARITVGNANISATTALQAINPMGRELALQRGCNVLMPILTPTKYRENYMLYEGKPCITDTAEECRNCLNARVSMVGKRIRDGVWADPPNFLHPVVMPRPDAWATSLARAGEFAAMPHKRAGPATVAAARGFRTSAAAARSAEPTPAASNNNSAQPGGPVKGSDVPRLNIGVFGCMNAGKSTLLNSITRSDSSIVDSTPGTTADTKIVLMELHDIGPVKLFDTAGIDETGELGQKKRQKVLSVLKESDLVVVVVDAERTALAGSLDTALSWERMLYQKAVKQEAVPLLLINTKGCADDAAPDLCSRIVSALTQPEAHASAPAPEAAEPMVMELDLNSSHAPTAIADWLQEAAKRSKAAHNPRSLPEQYLSPEAMVFLNIPMDLETPSMRLLRPQALLQEEAIRHWAPTLAYRMDLGKARSDDPSLVAQERRRFNKALKPLLDHDGPKIMVTDSQAVDIVHPWTLDPETGEELVAFTTFSIAMIHRQSGGRLPLFTSGLRAFAQLQPGDQILVAEACHHNRITELCNDIGMVQIPQQVERHAGAGIGINHAFGREFPDLEGGLDRFKLAVHCGGCMIDHQKIRARIMDLEEAGVPVTNYGLLLSYAHNPDALTRALAPWGVDPTF